jgi:hypothetical protein
LSFIGNIGKGGPLSSSQKIVLEVINVPDKPSLSMLRTVLYSLEDTVGVIGVDCCNWTSQSFGKSIYNISMISIQVLNSDDSMLMMMIALSVLITC